MKIRTFVAAAALIAAAGIAQAQAPQGDAKKGARLFRADGCWECHGTVGQGGAATAPQIAPMELPFDAFLHQLRVPQAQMPPYERSAVSDADAADIYVYLKTIAPPKKANQIPLLDNLH